MKINGEEVEIVTDYAQLGAGVLIYGVCSRCPNPHRGILMPERDEYRLEPKPPMCCSGPLFVGRGDVATRRVFRVVDSMKARQSTERRISVDA